MSFSPPHVQQPLYAQRPSAPLELLVVGRGGGGVKKPSTKFAVRSRVAFLVWGLNGWISADMRVGQFFACMCDVGRYGVVLASAHQGYGPAGVREGGSAAEDSTSRGPFMTPVLQLILSKSRPAFWLPCSFFIMFPTVIGLATDPNSNYWAPV